MAHYAKIENNIVTEVLVMSNDDPNPVAWLKENIGGTWIQTSYNTKGGIHYGDDGNPDNGLQFRYNYGQVGFIYDSTADAFYAPQPYLSWILDTLTYCWKSPVEKPNDGRFYYWNEMTKSWVEDNDQSTNTTK